MPELDSLQLTGDLITITDISPILAKSPKLSTLKLESCPYLTASEIRSGPSLVVLQLRKLPALTQAAAVNLLKLCRQAGPNCEDIRLIACPQITEVTLATVPSLLLRPQHLAFKLVPPHTFSSHLTSILETFIIALNVREMELFGEFPPVVQTKTLEKFGSRMNRNRKLSVRVDITVNDVRWQPVEPTAEED